MHIQLTNNNNKEIQLLFVSKLREAFKFQKQLNLVKIEQLYPTLLLLTFESSRTVQCFIFLKLCVYLYMSRSLAVKLKTNYSILLISFYSMFSSDLYDGNCKGLSIYNISR